MISLGHIPYEADVTIEELDDIINSKIIKISNFEYRCSDCDHAFRQKINLSIHIGGKHKLTIRVSFVICVVTVFHGRFPEKAHHKM